MNNIKFVLAGEDNEEFLNLWLSCMKEIGDDRKNEEIIDHGLKVLEIQKQKHHENKIFNIELCINENKAIGFCFYSIAEIKNQKDTEYGLIIKPLVDYCDYGYIMEYFIDTKYRI
jgi:hypothetical protein